MSGAETAALASACAKEIDGAFATYNFHFRTVSQRAVRRFVGRERRAAQRDGVQRIELYEHAVKRAVRLVRARLGERSQDHALWTQIRRHYAELIAPYMDLEFSKTYFSSITRRIFATVGVDPNVEFVAVEAQPIAPDIEYRGFKTFVSRGSSWSMFDKILKHFRFRVGYGNKTGCVEYLTEEVDAACIAAGGHYSIESVDLLREKFFRDNRCYIVGRINGAGYTLPLVVVLVNTAAGIFVDGVVTSEDDVSVVFSFSRSYFHVDLQNVRDAVAFLRDIVPQKPISEIYTALGRAKQGKTERYRDLFSHLEKTTDRFENAAFDRGMVMLVFTLPSYPVVFKIIRDNFAYPKTTVRQDVIERYRLVFKHDRAGRLVDAQEFRQLKFSRERFEPELLAELLKEAANTVKIEGDNVIIGHAYIERRLTPLNKYVKEAKPEKVKKIIIDYGQAIRDLAASNIFPGDLLLKNFGVTRHERVIFYDYDELCLLDECNFRDLPQAKTHEEEIRSGAWFYVGDHDVFPEQFASFLGIEGELLQAFTTAHAEILAAEYWQNMSRIAGSRSALDILPYRPRDTVPN